jgi:nicotinic acid mononucleotide adenylyltransferase
MHIVFSYQGAFAPPTYGHYKSMDTFIDRVITDYGSSSHDNTYTFLFMPTKKSSSKPHLEFTMDQRKEILQIFSDKLKQKYTDENIHIDPSTIEFDKDTSSDTINTIKVLEVEYPNAKIILGMGKDNALQLPYWANIGDYESKVDKIYLVQREVDGDHVRIFKNDKDEIIGTFDTVVPSWAQKNEKLQPVFEIKTEELIDGNKIPADARMNIGLPVIVEIEANIPPSSSSMIRHFISRIINSQEIQENKEKIKKLMFGVSEFQDAENIDATVESVITDYTRLNKDNYGVAESLRNSLGKQGEYDTEYNTYIRQIGSTTAGGGKKRTRKRKGRKTRRKSRRRIKTRRR